MVFNKHADIIKVTVRILILHASFMAKSSCMHRLVKRCNLCIGCQQEFLHKDLVKY